MSRPKFAPGIAFLIAATLAAAATSGHFEVYCDGIGFFLQNVDAAPAPEKLDMFLRTNFPGIPFVPKEIWRDVGVFSTGCKMDGKCAPIARGRIRLESPIEPYGKPGARVSGQFEIDLDGQTLRGHFAVVQRQSRHPARICM